MRESLIEDYLVSEVKKLKGEVRKVKWIGRNGAPDRLIFLPAYSPFVELKKPGKEPTAAQKREHKRMRICGMIVLVMSEYEHVDKFIADYKRKYGSKR